MAIKNICYSGEKASITLSFVKGDENSRSLLDAFKEPSHSKGTTLFPCE